MIPRLWKYDNRVREALLRVLVLLVVSSGGNGGDVKLCVVSLTVEADAVTTDNFTCWENVENKEEGPKH